MKYTAACEGFEHARLRYSRFFQRVPENAGDATCIEDYSLDLRNVEVLETLPKVDKETAAGYVPGKHGRAGDPAAGPAAPLRQTHLNDDYTGPMA